MRLLGNDFWDDIVDINDRHKNQKIHNSGPTKPQGEKPTDGIDKKGVSGITIFYRVLGSILLISTMIKTWFWSASVFDWALLAISLVLIGVHRRLGAYYVIERVKPAFLNLNERLTEVESKLAENQTESEETAKE